MKVERRRIAVFVVVAATLGCAPAARDPLPSWNDTPVKSRILEFVDGVTDPSSSSYVPPDDRVATFDHDGTIRCEEPFYAQLGFLRERLVTLAGRAPELRSQQPYKAALAGDDDYFHDLDLETLLRILLDAHDGMSQSRYVREARAYVDTALHPRWQRPFNEMAYQPMLELMDYLRANDFEVYIVSAGGMGFVRTFSERAYGVGPENVIGNSVVLELDYRSGEPVLVRQHDWEQPLNLGAGKPVNTQLHVGRRPILAVGNATGDLEMLEWAGGEGRPALAMVVHHDDAVREYAYEDGSEEILAAAVERGWPIVSIERDFKRVFPFEPLPFAPSAP